MNKIIPHDIIDSSETVKSLFSGMAISQIIIETDLSEGYNGKILMVAIMGGGVGKIVCLRSGDLWHREILKNTQKEIKDLGFTESAVYELGGASVRFEPNGDILIHGTSDDYGSCDKNLAAELIKKKFPGNKIIVMY
ncbi:MAG: hypothetical protein B6I30_08275 [Desulfobacteraceae bacterium 4572_187]|nr:MAG: hypothetical protein B6I30_08275 [Desulfobacteraceae bacterium 4572_187]